ncbi:TraB/GumN family protein [Porphyrobacter sp. AAP82]|uniref:TraB/GumN family protein n=1 Tax=Porphyrobacter sp. AAP82 TaxID=1248917 RepID=UPI0002F040DD|nr:TraB/GumN family protein [Porphyrobacter sp. AAP82]
MKLSSLLALTAAPFALFAANPALAQDPAGTAEPAAAAPKGPALWKVADADTTIYLFGTVHVLPQGLEWYDATIAKALDGSDILVTEIPMDPASEAAMAQMARQKGALPAGTTLRSLLNDEQKATYTAALTQLGGKIEAAQLAQVPAEARAQYEDAKAKGLVPAPGEMLAGQFDGLKPWMVGLTMSILPLTFEGYDPNSGVEKVLLGKVGTKEKGALETAEFQLGIFDSMPQDAQVTFLIEAAKSIDETKPMLDRMVAEWIEGDADQLAAVMNESMDDPKVADALLYARNRNWAEWIDTRLDQPGTVFIAVGAGHLAGAKSVQDYLAQKGIKVSRVK